MADPQFLEMMQDTVTVEAFLGQNANGEDTWATTTPKTSRAFIDKRPRMIRTLAGDERVASATVYLYKPIMTSPQDRITLPDGKQPPILSLAESKDEKKSIYQVVYT